MIKVQLMIASIRSKLGDTNGENYYYANTEIVEAINGALRDISQNALCFFKVWHVQSKKGVRRYKLPNDFILFSKKYPDNVANGLIDYVDSQTFFVKNGEPRIATEEGKYPVWSFYYNYTERIYGVDDTLYILDGFFEPIVYHALSTLCMSPNRENGLQQSEFFRAKYNEALRLPLHHARKVTNKIKKTSFRRV